MSVKNWDKNQEEDFKKIIKEFFDEKIDSVLKKSNNLLEIGDDLATILKNSDEDVVKLVTPRAVKKWASPQTLPKWEEIVANPRMLLELRVIGRSIANTMRPLAGNNFALWVAKILNTYFLQKKIPLEAITSGQIKRDLEKALKTKVGKKGVRDYRPDIDIILIRTDKGNEPVAIISAKTTLAERIMQTITWSRYLQIKVLLVTAWETFESGANRKRVQELDGVYVCNKDVKEYGKIKLFSKIVKDLEKFCR